MMVIQEKFGFRRDQSITVFDNNGSLGGWHGQNGKVIGFTASKVRVSLANGDACIRPEYLRIA